MASFRYVTNFIYHVYIWTLCICLLSIIAVSNSAVLLDPDPCPYSYYQHAVKIERFVTCCPCQNCSNEKPTKPLERISECSKDDHHKSCAQYKLDQCCKLSECNCETACAKSTRCKAKLKSGEVCKCESRMTAGGKKRKRCRNKNKATTAVSIPINFFTNKTSETPIKAASYSSVSSQIDTGETASNESNVSTDIPADVIPLTPGDMVHQQIGQVNYTGIHQRVHLSSSLRISVPALVIGCSVILFVFLTIIAIMVCLQHKKKANKKTRALHYHKQNSRASSIIADSSNDGSLELFGVHTEHRQLLNTSGAFSEGQQEKGCYEESAAILNTERPSSSNSESSVTGSSEAPPLPTAQTTTNMGSGNYYDLKYASGVRIVHNHNCPNMQAHNISANDHGDNDRRPTASRHPSMNNYDASYNSDAQCTSATAMGYSTLTPPTQESISSHHVRTHDPASVRSNPTYPIRQHTTDQLATNQSQHRSHHFQSEPSASSNSSLNGCSSKSLD